ncbi:hypothetical protein PENSPDRAFT_332555 [Peniophora sp. CONT]|nr:hypothetical protein PENSPDRAFT_332555 [Peniophora sp. CONT]
MYAQLKLISYGFVQFQRVSVGAPGARRSRKLRAGSRHSSHLQARLTDYSFICNQRKPCYINALPPELLMRILEPLPSMVYLWTRVHAKPSRLPRYDDERALEKVVGPWALHFAASHGGYATCIAEALFPQGCARFCSAKHWDYLELLLVCKHWRSVIEACPRFWSNIVAHNEGTVLKSLKLSGARPIRVVVDGAKRWPSKRALLSVLEQLDRVGEFEVATFLVKAQLAKKDIVHAFASSPASSLRSLRWDARDKEIVATQTWMEQSFPSLEVLAMYDATLTSPCSLLVPTLTSLTLSRCSPPWKTADELLLALSRMPSLETLFLWELPDMPDFEKDLFREPLTPHLPISLPHLIILNLEGSYRYVYRLLRMLLVPPGLSALNLMCSHRPYGLDLFGKALKSYTFFDTLAKSMFPGATFTDVHFNVDLDSGGVEVTIFGDTQTFFWKHTWDLSINDDRLPGDILAFLARICQSFLYRFASTDLQVNVTGSFDELSGDFFNAHICFAWLRSIPRVTGMQLKNAAATYVIPWMRHCLYDTSDAALPFPALRRLVISEANLVETISDDPTDILFKHLWLYLHDQRPEIVLHEVEITHRMYKYLVKMLGPWFRAEEITHVKGPCVRMEIAPHDQLYISIPPSTHETLVETP